METKMELEISPTKNAKMVHKVHQKMVRIFDMKNSCFTLNSLPKKLLKTSCRVVADKELIVESRDDMAAENSPPITKPTAPIGKYLITKIGTERLKFGDPFSMGSRLI